MKSEFLNVIKERGFMHQCTDLEALDEIMSKKTVPAYIGFDCTADSLHVGSLLQIMLFRWMQKTGHKPMVLMGGGTSKIGDPSFKDEARQLLDDAAIQKNMNGIKKVFSKYLTFGDGDTDAMMLNNADWLDSLEYIPFLRDFGKHFSVNRMLTFDSVKLRLDREQSLSFLEFNYMILQAYDFYELNKKHGIMLQMGGSDQWGNIVNGVELTRRVSGKEVFGLTSPLITTSSGVKMGKTLNGAVWLNEERLSSYDYWQFWRNTEDGDVGKFLRIFTELPLDEIARLEKLEGAEINEAKKILANEATKLCHGEEKAVNAAETARKTFEEGQLGAELPVFEISKADFDGGTYDLITALNDSGLCNSKGEAKRLVKQGGARVNDAQVTDIERMLQNDDVKDGSIKLSSGKKKHLLIKVV
ncbi:MAG: tyrosine--tRNA ligase [Alphaproteobacteria bacterium]|nr:tyrosine--tRNA ligase [Alphaproteobacteria bacterium]